MEPGIVVIAIFILSIIYRLRKNRKKKNDEQFIRNIEFSRKNRSASELARYDRLRAERIGATKFRWHTAGDSGCCSNCAKNNGKVFRWKRPPKTGLPGEGKCCPGGKCRCWAETIVPPPKR
ncbi:phage minor head protein [Enterobacter chengduensis]|uniref:phage minor head protein n=1 Tax=Enterobacter chengduensis TaxID=2494701 RepID=UPI0009407832